MVKKIKVIVVDDSALMRKIISDMINSEDDMEVIEIAKNGEDLLNKLSNKMPDVITLDIEMPKMDGMQALKALKERHINIPVIMLSSVSKRGTELTMECLENGAFDFLPKPSGAISLDINKIKDELAQRIRLANNKGNVIKPIEKIKRVSISENLTNQPIINKRKSVSRNKIEAVVIGASTGGPKALYKVITMLPQKLGVPVFVVQHMPTGFTKAFAERLNNNSEINVVEATDNQLIQKDMVYIAPGGLHMEVSSDNKIHLNMEPPIWGVRPAVDKLFISASKVYGANIVSVVLTGMGKDGAQGTVEIKNGGGLTISEDESTCTIYGMPKATFETGCVDEVLKLDDVAIGIRKAVMGS